MSPTSSDAATVHAPESLSEHDPHHHHPGRPPGPGAPGVHPGERAPRRRPPGRRAPPGPDLDPHRPPVPRPAHAARPDRLAGARQGHAPRVVVADDGPVFSHISPLADPVVPSAWSGPRARRPRRGPQPASAGARPPGRGRRPRRADDQRAAGGQPRPRQGDLRGGARPPRAARAAHASSSSSRPTSWSCPSPRSRSWSSPSTATTPAGVQIVRLARPDPRPRPERGAAPGAGLRRRRGLRRQAVRRRRPRLGHPPSVAARRARRRRGPRAGHAGAAGDRRGLPRGVRPAALRRGRPGVRRGPQHRGRQRLPELHGPRRGAGGDRRAAALGRHARRAPADEGWSLAA